MDIKRKYCNLHGWAPHFEEEDFWFCSRCFPSTALTTGKRILATLRGFKLHKSMTAKAYLASKTKPETV